MHPLRMRIVVALSAEDLTTRQVHQLMPEVSQASLYRAVSQLVAGGMIEVVGEERRGGALERTYRVVLGHAPLSDEELGSTSPGEVLGVVETLSDMVVTAAGRYLAEAGDAWEPSQLTLRHTPVWLTDEDRVRLHEDVLALMTTYGGKQRSPDARLYSVNIAIVPEPARTTHDSADGA